MINGSIDQRQTAHWLLTQIVNSLTAKMEIGAPMAAMYLLGNPDHYTDHKFCSFYWKSYVCKARSPWKMDMDNQKGDKVAIRNKGGKIMAVTPVQDYTFRPLEYENMCLYDWIQLYNKKPKPRSQSKSINKMYAKHEISVSDGNSENDSDIDSTMSNFHAGEGYGTDVEMTESSDIAHTISDGNNVNADNITMSASLLTLWNSNYTDDRAYKSDVSESGTLVDGDSDIDLSSHMEDDGDFGSDMDNAHYDGNEREVYVYTDPNADAVRKSDRILFPFMDGHPLQDTHHVNCLPEIEEYIPNFTGTLPRSDQGDREYYCSTMLTLFEPWRHGKDLRHEDESWEYAFCRFSFTPRQQELMKFFNLRYECLDAQDDFHAELKRREDNYLLGEMDNDIYNDRHIDDLKSEDKDELDEYEHDCIHIGKSMGKATKTMFNKMESMDNIMKASGWFDKSPDGPPDCGSMNHVEPSMQLCSKEWEKKIYEKGQQLSQEHMSIQSKHDEVSLYDDEVFNYVRIVDQSYLKRNTRLRKLCTTNTLNLQWKNST